MKVELLVKKDAPLSVQARAVLEELREELGLEIEEIDVTEDSFLYRRHRYDLPVVRLDGQVLSQRTADRDEIARRLRHARTWKENQAGVLGDGRRVVKVTAAGAAAPYRTTETSPTGPRRVVKVSLAEVAGQALPRTPATDSLPEAGEETDKLEPLPLPPAGGEVFFVDGFGGGALRRRLAARPGVDAVRVGPATGVAVIEGAPEAVRAAVADHGGRAKPSPPALALALGAAALALGLAPAGVSGGLAWAAGAIGALLPLALREGRWLLRDLPLVGAYPLIAAAGLLFAAWSGAVLASLAALPAAVHLVGLAFVLHARRRARTVLSAFDRDDGAKGRQLVGEGAPFPADGRLLAACVVDERPLGGDEDAERLDGEAVFAGTIARTEVEFVAEGGPSRAHAGGQRVIRALAEVGDDRTTRLLLFAPLGALVLAGAAWILAGPRAGTSVLAGLPVLALAFFLPVGRAASLVRALVDGVAVATWRAIARAGAVRTVVFGKRALLERGVCTVLGVRTRKYDVGRLLALAAAAEKDVDHPIARAIVGHAEELGLEPPAPKGAPRVEAGGVEARVEGATVRVGAPAYLTAKGIDVSAFLGPAHEMGQRGSTPVVVAIDGEAAGLIEIGASPTDGARQAIASLELREVEVYLATADHGQRARWLAQAFGLDPARAVGEMSAEKEDKMLRGLRRPVLLAAGTTHRGRTTEADLVVGAEGDAEGIPASLLRPDPRGVAALVRIARRARRGRVLGRSALGLGCALVLGLGPFGLLSPMTAAAVALVGTAVALGAALAPDLAFR